MKTVELKAMFRERLGKAAVKQVRKEKRIPAVVYGRQTKPTSIDVDYKEFEHVVHTKAGGNVIISLKVTGKQTLDQTVIIKDIQLNPVNDQIEHIDFNVISLTEKIKVNVQLVIKGESMGVKEGGILDIVRHEIEVECLPTEIPEKLEADISTLNMGDAIHISDIQFPADVICLVAPDEVVVAVHAPKAEETKPAEEGAPGEPEVITKGKEEAVEGEAKEAPKVEEKPEKQEKTEKKAEK